MDRARAARRAWWSLIGLPIAWIVGGLGTLSLVQSLAAYLFSSA